MGVAEGVGYFENDLDCVLDRKLRFAIESVAQRLAFHEGHDIEEQPCGVARVEHAEDVRVLQLGSGPDLALEAVAADRRRQFGMKDLDGNLAVVLQVPCQVDGGHAAGAELALDVVSARELGAQLV